MGLVRSDSSAWRRTFTKVGVLGFSAGAHLAARVATEFALRSYVKIDAADDFSCRPDFALLLYPWCVIGHHGRAHAHCDAEVNHTLTVTPTATTPPTFLVQAEDDWGRANNALVYFRALQDVHAAASELHVFPTGGHGFGLCSIREWSICKWPERAADFLRAHADGMLSSPTLEASSPSVSGAARTQSGAVQHKASKQSWQRMGGSQAPPGVSSAGGAKYGRRHVQASGSA